MTDGNILGFDPLKSCQDRSSNITNIILHQVPGTRQGSATDGQQEMPPPQGLMGTKNYRLVGQGIRKETQVLQEHRRKGAAL